MLLNLVVEYFQIFFSFFFQLDGGITTPPNELEDISEFGMFFSQVDGGNDDDEKIPGNKLVLNVPNWSGIVQTD